MTSENPEIENRLKAALERVAELEQELERSKLALADLNTWFTATIESIPGDFFAIGTDGRYVQQNSICRKRGGGDLIGKSPEDVASADTLSIWMDNNRRAFAGETVRGEVEFEVDGEKRFYFNVVTPVRDQDKIRGILGVNIDITDRKRAELALRESREKLEDIVDERTSELLDANKSLVHERQQLQEKNIALGEMIAQIDLQKKRTEASVQTNVDRTIAPILKRLEKVVPADRRFEIKLLQKALSDITSPFVSRLESTLDKLTARETEVCDLIRRGLQAKEIAEVLSLSVSTINKFRQRIRKKLGISGQKINLCTHLRSFQTDE